MKNTKFLKIVGVLLVGLFIISFSGKAEAATLTILPQASQVSVGDKISLDVKIDSSGDSINAAQSSVRFPKDIINVESIDKTNSVFNFWLEDPNFSNSDGIISFIGGTAHGISGASLHIIKINFVAKSVGIANITLQDSAITSSDGSGTNVLSKTNDGVVSVVAEKVVPEAPIAPKQIVREPVFAGKLPEKPNIRIPLYPDSTKWYNLIGSFNAIWDLPLDISGISTAVNHQPSFIPAAKSEGLFDDKSFPALSDGIIYLHVRFKNNVGWGPTQHYKIAIDTQPPLAFDVKVLESFPSDNPVPTLQFNTNDSLSGISEYKVLSGNGDLMRIPADSFSGEYKVLPQAPGKQYIIVRAVDNAGNSVESGIDIEILPIASPVISYINKDLFKSGGGFEMEGTAVAGEEILFSLKNSKGSVAYSGSTQVDQNGNWYLKINQPFKTGTYFAEITAQDERGATSLSVKSDSFRSNVGGINITIIVTILLIIIFIVLLLRSPRELLSKVPVLAFLRMRIEKGLTTLIGDKFRYYEGDLQSLTKSFDYIQDHVVVTDSHGNILYANKAMEEMTGFKQEDVIGKNPGDLWGGGMSEDFYQKMWHTIKVEKKKFIGKVKNKRKNGQEYMQDLRVYPVLDDK